MCPASGAEVTLPDPKPMHQKVTENPLAIGNETGNNLVPNLGNVGFKGLKWLRYGGFHRCSTNLYTSRFPSQPPSSEPTILPTLGIVSTIPCLSHLARQLSVASQTETGQFGRFRPRVSGAGFRTNAG